MSFDMRTENIVIGDDRGVFQCLEAWRQQIREDGCGEMTVVRNGELTRIKVSKPGEAVDLEMSNIKIHHKYQDIQEPNGAGGWELSLHFCADILGKNGDDASVKVHLYINHTCEDASFPWDKSLSISGGVLNRQ